MSESTTPAPRPLHLVVNGAPRTVAPGTTVAGLLAELCVSTDGVAVAIDMQVVPRGQHPHRRLEEGDRVEVVQAVGGG